MYLKVFKPRISSFRFKRTLKFVDLYKYKFKNLLIRQPKKAGRNYTGQIVTRHRGGSNNKNFIKIDLYRTQNRQYAICYNILYDTSRTTYLSLLRFANGTYSYILAPAGLINGDIVKSCQFGLILMRSYKVGYATFLTYLTINDFIYNVEFFPEKGGKCARAAGTYCLINRIDDDKNIYFIRIPSGIIISLSGYCFVSLGRASNIWHKLETFTKAGRNRQRGIRPTVRGVAMNPVDHPHGGRTKTSCPEVTP